MTDPFDYLPYARRLPNGDVLHMPPNEQRIDALWAFVSVNAQGLEGILSWTSKALGVMPLVTASEKNVKLMRPTALEIANESGLTVRLVKFTKSELLETFEP